MRGRRRDRRRLGTRRARDRLRRSTTRTRNRLRSARRCGSGRARARRRRGRRGCGIARRARDTYAPVPRPLPRRRRARQPRPLRRAPVPRRDLLARRERSDRSARRVRRTRVVAARSRRPPGCRAPRKVGAGAAASATVYDAIGDAGAAAALLGGALAMDAPGIVAIVGTGGGRTTGVLVHVDAPVPGAAVIADAWGDGRTRRTLRCCGRAVSSNRRARRSRWVCRPRARCSCAAPTRCSGSSAGGVSTAARSARRRRSIRIASTVAGRSSSRCRHPRDDIASTLMHAEVEDENGKHRLTTAELGSFFLLLVGSRATRRRARVKSRHARTPQLGEPRTSARSTTRTASTSRARRTSTSASGRADRTSAWARTWPGARSR